MLIASGGRWAFLVPLSVVVILAEQWAAFRFGGHAREAAGFVTLVVVLLLRPVILRIGILLSRREPAHAES